MNKNNSGDEIILTESTTAVVTVEFAPEVTTKIFQSSPKHSEWVNIENVGVIKYCINEY